MIERNRVVRHHSIEVSNHNDANTAAPICQTRTSSVLAAIPSSLIAAGVGALAVFDGAAGTVAPDDGAAAPSLASNTGAAKSAIASSPRSVSKYGTRPAGSAGRAP